MFVVYDGFKGNKIIIYSNLLWLLHYWGVDISLEKNLFFILFLSTQVNLLLVWNKLCWENLLTLQLLNVLQQQDHYKVLGLEKVRHKATMGDIKKACRFPTKKTCILHKAVNHLLGACFGYINEPLELSSSQHKRNMCGANFNILPRNFNRVKGGCMFSVTTSKCCNHLLRRIRTSSSVNILKNVLYKHLRLGQIRDRTFIPFSSNHFLTECVIIGYL